MDAIAARPPRRTWPLCERAAAVVQGVEAFRRRLR